MNQIALLFRTFLLFLLFPLWGVEKISNFTHSVQTERKPWTQKEFINDPKDFQFAIVSDRTGGPRLGVFPRAVEKLNQLRPEFVITVGDLIKGGAGNRNVEKLKGEWKEFNSFVDGFDMPFFYLPGNHDLGNEVADQIWDEMFGVRYYSFVYENVLFLCLNTQGGPGSKPALLQDEQIDELIGKMMKAQKAIQMKRIRRRKSQEQAQIKSQKPLNLKCMKKKSCPPQIFLKVLVSKVIEIMLFRIYRLRVTISAID